MVDEFSTYTFGEQATGIGQLVEFTCKPEEREMVKQFIKKHIRTITLPVTGCSKIGHGGHCGFTRFDVTQHKYAGGPYGFIEVLEIKNPPDNHYGIVMYCYDSREVGSFSEWGTVENAVYAFDACVGFYRMEEKLPEFTGFKRLVNCGALTPWFYAIGDERLIGDYTFPDGLQDDSVYRFGRQFIVTTRDGKSAIRTCMGTRFMNTGSGNPAYRIVYFSNGEVWDERSGRKHPSPVEDGEG